MSASSKFDLSSASPDRALYASGPRGSYGVASLDRSSSFRESMENPLSSSVPNMSRSSSSVSQGDVLSFFQCVRFDPKSMVVEHKLNRPAEFRRLASAAVGIPLEDSLPVASKNKQLSSSAEDLRRLKSGVRESGTKARERVKILNDCLSVIDNCFPTIPSRKRSRLDALSNDRSCTSSSIDRSSAGISTSKIRSQNPGNSSAPDLEMQKCEERSKNATPKKRPRTSINDSKMDVRVNPSARPSGTMVKDRDTARLGNAGVIQEQDKSLSIAVDGWEKSKMKKKRTGIKQDIGASSMVTKPADGYRESKHGLQSRVPTETRSRLTDSHGFRTGIPNGGVGTGRAEATSQTSSGMRSSVSRTDSESSSLLQERRERSGVQEKERTNLKSVDKANSREDFSSGSPTSGSKLNANVRAPRSISVAGGSKLSQVANRSSPSNDWELSNCTSKLPGLPVANNRKRTPSARSSSPPVSNWVQRPQKISRTARRTHLLPIFPTNDESAAMEATSNGTINDQHLSAHSPQQIRIKNDAFSPATLSESEESGAAEVGFIRSKKGGKIEEKRAQNVQKMSTLPLPPRKKKVTGDDHGDGVRRQGRTGRGFISSRSLLPLTADKLGRNAGTTKQVRSSRLGPDKIERQGRPPTRKLSDRKAYTRQKHVAVNGTDFLVGSDIGHEDLLAAVKSVTDTVQGLSSPFWKVMETLFRFISDKDIFFLKDQVNVGSVVNTPAPVPFDADSSTLVPNGYGLNEYGREESEGRSVELSSEHLTTGAKTPTEISLYQRLMSAIIPEEAFNEKENKYDIYGCQLEMEKDVDGDIFCPGMPQSHELSGYASTNGNIFCELVHPTQDANILPILDSGVIESNDNYLSMSLNEKLHLEINSIGIYPDLGGGDDELNRDISRLDEEYQEKVSRKKGLLSNLLSCACEAKDLQEKGFGGIALDKLVGMAYEKYMSCTGPNAHGTKSSNGKIAKQAVLAFVKRVLERHQDFELTGKSCFDEPLYKELFVSRVSCLADGSSNLSIDNGSGKLVCSASGYLSEVRTPGSLGTQQSPNILDLYPELQPESNQITGIEEETWSHRAKRRELLLDDVGGMMSTTPGIPSSLGGSLSSSAKGKRSERDREAKGTSRQASSRSGTGKIGRPASTSVKGERKSKAKPKQKNTNLSGSISLAKMPKQPNEITSSTLKSSEFGGSDIDTMEEPIDLSALQIPGDLGGQGEDISSWLNIEDVGEDGLQEDYEPLAIPMDDLEGLGFV